MISGGVKQLNSLSKSAEFVSLRTERPIMSWVIKRKLFSLLIILVSNLVGAAFASEAELPVVKSRGLVTFKALFAPNKPPPGANNWACHSVQHPYPVILIPGTFNNMQVAYGSLSPLLVNAGYCVFATNYGGKRDNSYVQSTGPMDESNRKLAAFVAEVLEKTGAPKVILVGHSQGGLHAIRLARSAEFANKIDTVVGLAPTTHGTEVLEKFATTEQPTLAGALIKKICVACEEQRNNSQFVFSGDTDSFVAPGVKYHILATRDDYVILPPSRSFINNAQADNNYLQDICPHRHVSHRGLLYDKAADAWVLSVLAGEGSSKYHCGA